MNGVMHGVMLRCPNCGTTKVTPGECEACHEAQVRYYCTNHKPGRWLETRVCSQCGARFGDPARPTPATTPSPPPSPVPPTPTASRTSSAPARSTPPPSPWGRRKRAHSPGGEIRVGSESTSVPDGRTARMLELLRAAARASRASRSTAHLPEPPPVGAALGGCLMRLVTLAIFLLIIFTLFLFLLGGSLLQMFEPYY